MKLKQMIPMLNVSNIEKSIEFYTTSLGFKIVSDPEAVSEWRWAMVRSGGVELMLSETEAELSLSKDIDPQADVSWPCIYYFYPDDVFELYESLKKAGFKVTELITTIYGMNEFSLQDPDGHMLSFGQDA